MPYTDDPISLLVEASDPFEAERLRQVLEAEGIPVSVAPASNLPITGITGAVGPGGTRIMVKNSDYERAAVIRDDFIVPSSQQPISESYVSRRTKALFRSLLETIRGK